MQNSNNSSGTKSINKCPHCKLEVDAKGSRCPHCQGKIYRWTKGRKILAGFAVFAVILVMISDSGGNKNPSQETQVQSRESISIVFAESKIKDILKAPSTAKFANVRAYELTDQKDIWEVNGYVDSQNGFGAMIRSQWEVQLDYTNGKGGTVKSIMFDGKKVQ